MSSGRQNCSGERRVIGKTLNVGADAADPRAERWSPARRAAILAGRVGPLDRIGIVGAAQSGRDRQHWVPRARTCANKSVEVPDECRHAPSPPAVRSKRCTLPKERVERDEEDLVRLYLTDIGQYPLLTKDDEVRLAQAIEAGNEARAESRGGQGPDAGAQARAAQGRSRGRGRRAHLRAVEPAPGGVDRQEVPGVRVCRCSTSSRRATSA